MKRFIFLFIFLISFQISEGQNPPITPAWAFKHIVWEDSLNTSVGARQIVDAYLQRDIPVGGIIIDSPWSTAYCDFNWDTDRYPDHRELCSYFKEKNVKVILWMTGAVNCTSVDSPLQKHEAFDEIVARKYGINESKPGNGGRVTAYFWISQIRMRSNGGIRNSIRFLVMLCGAGKLTMERVGLVHR